MPPTEIVAAKRALRAQLQQARDRRDPDQRRRDDAARRALVDPLLAELRPATVATYLPVGSEPGLAGLLEDLRGSGVRVLLPVVGPRMVLGWADYTGPEALREARFGLLEPTGPVGGPDMLAEAGLVVVPAMAIDRHGLRLGKGASCYDRALPHARAGVPLVGVLDADEELLDTVPGEPHDQRVTDVVTPTRLLSLAARDAPADQGG